MQKTTDMAKSRKKINRVDMISMLSGYSRATVYMAYQGHSDNADVLRIIGIVDDEEKAMWDRVKDRVKGRISQKSDDISGMNL